MEMRRKIIPAIKRRWLTQCILLALLLLPVRSLYAQDHTKKYTISKGGMQITLGKGLAEAELNEFIQQYDLGALALKKLISSNYQDSVKLMGWKIELDNASIIVISKPFFSADNINDPAQRISLTGTDVFFDGGSPVPMNNQVFGINNFRSRHAFDIKDSTVTFVLRNNKNAQKVVLAASFTNWQTGALPMAHTDSGWVISVKLRPGKYLYKFIADGNWLTDPDNASTENDDKGNTNSVYYYTNMVFRLDAFPNAKKVYVSGSFNNWQPAQLRMNKTSTGWELPLYLAMGTYTYRYVVDGRWLPDPANPDLAPNEFGDFNSLVNVGKPMLFTLAGHQDAQNVFLAGSFNKWRSFELPMRKTAGGWQLPYVLGPGNYEYKFFADGKWLNAQGNAIQNTDAGSIMVINANYTFRLKNAANAKNVFVSGDFNGWSPNGYRMQKDGNDWLLQVYLSPGKHLYKFVVDGQWIKDPGNTLWEQNEFDTGNSVLWVE